MLEAEKKKFPARIALGIVCGTSWKFVDPDKSCGNNATKILYTIVATYFGWIPTLKSKVG
jgi:secreted trypsin-like serine protease